MPQVAVTPAHAEQKKSALPPLSPSDSSTPDAGHNDFPSSSTATGECYKLIPPSIIQKAHNIISEIETHKGIGKLSEVENKLVIFGLAALLQSDERNSPRQEYLKAMMDEEKLSNGKQPESKFALDSEQLQIGRKYGPENFQRFGIILDNENKTTRIQMEEKSVYNADEINLHSLAPDVASYVNNCHRDGKLVLAVLGPARVSGNDTQKIFEMSATALENIMTTRGNNIAVMTGGYKGELDGVYGATRAGYDITKTKGVESLAIMPKAGEKDSHINVGVKNIVGEMWGDDTKALIAASDAALVFEPHGLWTEIEIANLKRQEKPYCLLDLKQKDSAIHEAVSQLNMHPLLTPEELNKKYNPNVSAIERRSLRKKGSSDFDHSRQLWIKVRNSRSISRSPAPVARSAQEQPLKRDSSPYSALEGAASGRPGSRSTSPGRER